ncbi:MAG: VIT1/CCC1 transporter family protein, partial [Candidatus Omnitrophica bacterium]|nr:VIT1/CCC1 transporter family protein [Candidatus Omnitrophota bacterium]
MKQLIRSPLEERLKNWHGEDWHTTKGRIIRDIIYAIDTGLITTVSFLAGVSVSWVGRDKVILASIAQITAGTLAIFLVLIYLLKPRNIFLRTRLHE